MNQQQQQEFLAELAEASLSAEGRKVVRALFDGHLLHGKWHGTASMEFYERHTGLSQKAILKALYAAFKARWLTVDVYVNGQQPIHPHTYRLIQDPTLRKREQSIKKARPKPDEMTLGEWEAINGRLMFHMVHQWAHAKNLTPAGVSELIDEFREEMQGKGKKYADFAAAFKTYLNKGYLSLSAAQITNKISTDGVQIHSRGVNL